MNPFSVRNVESYIFSIRKQIFVKCLPQSLVLITLFLLWIYLYVLIQLNSLIANLWIIIRNQPSILHSNAWNVVILLNLPFNYLKDKEIRPEILACLECDVFLRLLTYVKSTLQI